jgi:DNA-binding GntR family transcriptional regulator
MTRRREEGWLAGLSPLSRTPLGDRTYEQILGQILSGRIAGGEHLVEQALAKQMGISRISVRQALQQLAHEGLIEIIPNRGAYVRRFTAEDIEEVFRLRAALEAMAAELVTVHAGAQGVADLQKAVDELAAVEWMGDRLRGSEVDTEFHRRLMLLSRQRRAYAIWQSMSAQITMVVYSASSNYPSFEGFAARHQRIVDLIRARDGQTLAAYLRQHILEGGQHLVDALRQAPMEGSEP